MKSFLVSFFIMVSFGVYAAPAVVNFTKDTCFLFDGNGGFVQGLPELIISNNGAAIEICHAKVIPSDTGRAVRWANGKLPPGFPFDSAYCILFHLVLRYEPEANYCCQGSGRRRDCCACIGTVRNAVAVSGGLYNPQ